VPIRILIGAETFPDGAVPHADLLASDEPVSTSGPSPGDFLAALDGADSGIVITVSHDLAEGTYLAARAAAGAADIPVAVLDSGTAAGAQGLIVMAAARAASTGGSLGEVGRVASEVAGRVRLVATLPGIDHLARSGHVPEAAAWANRWIGLQPIIELRNGSIRPMRPALSRSGADDRMLAELLGSRPSPDAGLHLAVLDALDPSRAASLLDAATAEVEPREVFTGSFGSAMILHSGPGVVGFAWWWEAP
jgi:DegV family protein with EDD domain